jgi:hypothetical protein
MKGQAPFNGHRASRFRSECKLIGVVITVGLVAGLSALAAFGYTP